MNLETYLKAKHGRGAELARATGLAPAFINQMAKGLREVPAVHCASIEIATGGSVTRQELRPDDWQKIWPELAGKTRKTKTKAA